MATDDLRHKLENKIKKSLYDSDEFHESYITAAGYAVNAIWPIIERLQEAADERNVLKTRLARVEAALTYEGKDKA